MYFWWQMLTISKKFHSDILLPHEVVLESEELIGSSSNEDNQLYDGNDSHFLIKVVGVCEIYVILLISSVVLQGVIWNGIKQTRSSYIGLLKIIFFKQMVRNDRRSARIVKHSLSIILDQCIFFAIRLEIDAYFVDNVYMTKQILLVNLIYS